MNLGSLFLWLCMIATIGAVVAYIVGAFNRQVMPVARMCYYAMAAGTVATSVYLLVLILKHDFGTKYVTDYSSTVPPMPLIYLFSSFWAGQEGSFLIWALFAAIIGLVLIAKSRDYEPWLMAFWSLVQALFFTLLLVKSPFAATPPDVAAQFPNGQGLNPLLQNFWMAIHPPLVFIGYAAMTVPAAFVTAALINKDYKSWCNRCLPWAIFGWLTLGSGIILGSYWAYEVLGWGGYWGWDPVENASLVPWIAGTALIHGMLVERYRGSMRVTNIALAFLSFLLVIFATFLTRSGFLEGFSAHSFSGSGSNAYLIGFMIAFAVICTALFFWRGIGAQSRSWYHALRSKESAFFITIICLCALALLILVGTSLPAIIKGIMPAENQQPSSLATLLQNWGLSKISVQPEFYGTVSSPISIVLLVMLALAPLLLWTGKTSERKGGSSPWLAITSVALVVVLLGSLVWLKIAGLNMVVLSAIGASGAIAMAVNAWHVWRSGRRGWKTVGGYLAHTGVAMMFIGMVCSPSMQPMKQMELLQGGKPVERLGYKFTFLGVEVPPDGGNVLKIKVEKGNSSFIASPVMRNTTSGVMHEPDIHASFIRDLYIAPSEVLMPEIKPELVVTAQGVKTPSVSTPDGGAQVRLMRVDATSGTASILVTQPGEKPVALTLGKGQQQQVGKYTFFFSQFAGHDEPQTRGEMKIAAKLTVDYPGAMPRAYIGFSVKNLISLFWLGSLLVLVGGTVAIVRRVGENKKILTAGETSGLEVED